MSVKQSDSSSGRLPRRRRLRRLALVLTVMVVASPVLARLYIHCAAWGRVHNKLRQVPHARVALVLGAKVRPNGSLSVLLADRVDSAIALYKAGVVDKLLMSGDNRFSHYNEPRRMRDYAIKRGVPAKDVAMDFAGRRTYDSVYRAKHIFGIKRMVVVSQRFHLDRAIFLCDRAGVHATGFAADKNGHRNMRVEVREYAASLGAIADVYLRKPRPVGGKRESM